MFLLTCLCQPPFALILPGPRLKCRKAAQALTLFKHLIRDIPDILQEALQRTRSLGFCIKSMNLGSNEDSRFPLLATQLSYSWPARMVLICLNTWGHTYSDEEQPLLALLV